MKLGNSESHRLTLQAHYVLTTQSPLIRVDIAMWVHIDTIQMHLTSLELGLSNGESVTVKKEYIENVLARCQ